jgi:hypothetical protein
LLVNGLNRFITLEPIKASRHFFAIGFFANDDLKGIGIGISWQVASQEQSDLMRFPRIAGEHWFDKTIVFPNSRQTAFLSQKPPCNGSKYSFRKTKFNLFEQDE